MQKIMLIILGFSLVVIQSSCNLFKKDDTQTETTDNQDANNTADDYEIDDFDDSEVSEDDFDEEDLADLLEEEDQPAGELADDEASSQPATSAPNENADQMDDRSPKATTPTSTDGNYLVIAGNFSSEANAQRLVDQLVGLGYTGAEIVYFKSKEFHTVCAGKYDSRSEAGTASRELRNNHEIETYVHKKR